MISPKLLKPISRNRSRHSSRVAIMPLSISLSMVLRMVSNVEITFRRVAELAYATPIPFGSSRRTLGPEPWMLHRTCPPPCWDHQGFTPGRSRGFWRRCTPSAPELPAVWLAAARPTARHDDCASMAVSNSFNCSGLSSSGKRPKKAGYAIERSPVAFNWIQLRPKHQQWSASSHGQATQT